MKIKNNFMDRLFGPAFHTLQEKNPELCKLVEQRVSSRVNDHLVYIEEKLADVLIDCLMAKDCDMAYLDLAIEKLEKLIPMLRK